MGGLHLFNIFNFLDSEGGAAERFFLFFFPPNRGSAALQMGGEAETLIFYFGS